MRKFIGYVRTDMVGSRVNFSFDVDDDATDEEIDEYMNELASNYYEIGCKEIK